MRFDLNKLVFMTLILLVSLFVPQSFAQAEKLDGIHLYGKGIANGGNLFAGQYVRTLVNGESGALIYGAPNGIVIVRMSLSQNVICSKAASTICLNGIVSGVKNSGLYHIDDTLRLVIDLNNRKENVSFLSGPLGGYKIEINLKDSKTWLDGEFTIHASKSGGIKGISEGITINVAGKKMIFQNSLDKLALDIDNSSVTELKNAIRKSKFFDIEKKEYPYTLSAVNHYTYTVEISSGQFSKTIRWTDTSKDVPPQLVSLYHDIENIGSLNLHENNDLDNAVKVAQQFTTSHPTFKFDGIPESLEIKPVGIIPSDPPLYKIQATFDSRHSGYGDRSGQTLTHIITPHTMIVLVSDYGIGSAIIDGHWDEFNQLWQK